MDPMVYNLLGFWNFDFWPYGHLAQISAILIFWQLQKLYVHKLLLKLVFPNGSIPSKSEQPEWGFWRTSGNSPHPSYKLQFTDTTSFIAKSLSNLVNNLSEGIHGIKCKYRHEYKKCETCEIKYKYCACFLEYTNFKDNLIE